MTKPNRQQQAILDLVEADSRETLVDWIRTNAIDFAKYSESDCGLSHGSARAVAQASLELLESAIHSLKRYDDAGKRPLGQRMNDVEKRSIAPDRCSRCHREFTSGLQGRVKVGQLCAECSEHRPAVPNSDFGVNKGTY